MAGSRLAVAADLLLKEDLVYELSVRNIPLPAADFTVYSLLALYRENESAPIIPENVKAYYPDDDFSALELKVEQVRELSLALLDGTPTEKQVRRVLSKVDQVINRIKDASECGKFSESLVEQLQSWQSCLDTIRQAFHKDKPEGNLTGTKSQFNTDSLLDAPIVPNCQSNEIGGAVPGVVLNNTASAMLIPPLLSSQQVMFGNFGKLPHPLTQLLSQVPKYNVSSLENTLAFLLFLDTVATQVKILNIDIRPVLAVIFSKLTQPLADLFGTGIQAGYDIDRLHDHILEVFFPARARMTVVQRYYYRVQGISEPLNDYIREVKTYGRVLRVTNNEEEVVGNILNGLSPVVRSCLNFEARPRNFAELDALCIRVMAVLHADTLRTSNNNNNSRNLAARSYNVSATVSNSVPSRSSRQVICYHCRAPGHVVRNCPVRGRRGGGPEADQQSCPVQSDFPAQGPSRSS